MESEIPDQEEDKEITEDSEVQAKIEEIDKETEETNQKTQEVKKQTEEQTKMLQDLMSQMKSIGSNPKDPKNREAMEEFKKYNSLYKKHDFWDTQPVPKTSLLTKDDTEGEIQKGNIKEVPTEPYNLPAGYQWSDIDLDDEEQLNEVYELLRDHYVEDSDHTFRFDYQKEFLKWALQPPKQHSDWVFGVRGGKKNRLFGFITGIPVKVRIKGKLVQMTEINFL